MKRRILSLAAAVSALLCVAMLALWLRSYWVWEDLYVYHAPRYTRSWALPYVGSVRSSGGGFSIGFLRPLRPIRPEEVKRMQRDFPRWGYEPHRELKPVYPGVSLNHLSRPWRAIGIDRETYWSHTEFADYWVHRVVLPYWLPAVLAAVLPASWLRNQTKHRRRARHCLCSACGYDLRATPDRCPECGTVPAKGAA